MTKRSSFGTAAVALALMFGPSCDDDDSECEIGTNEGCDDGSFCEEVGDGTTACYCSVLDQTGCEEGLVCERIDVGHSACFAPIFIKGRVFDLTNDAAIGGAHVLARDANNVAASGVAITAADGTYTVDVRATRNVDGAVVPQDITMRADANGFQTFPTPPRVALPVEVSNASGDPPTIQSASTEIGMLPLPPGDRGAISGTINAPRPGGTLLVAGGGMEGGGVTGISHTDGTYTVFNVPAGNASVRGYKVGLNLSTASGTVVANETVTGVNLDWVSDAVARVDGKIELVNPEAGKDTSVIFVVREAFFPNVASGEAPPGLRVGHITGAFAINGVPDGNYVVLAAFENDFLVRDPDTAIGGTDIVYITVAGGSMTIDQSFKVTGALDVVRPDNEEPVSNMPELVWADDSGEDHYEIRVYNAFGELMWEKLDVPGVSGDQEVTVVYNDNGTGMALVPGMLYQFRATSIKQGGTPISRTEDLRGVFLVQ